MSKKLTAEENLEIKGFTVYWDESGEAVNYDIDEFVEAVNERGERIACIVPLQEESRLKAIAEEVEGKIAEQKKRKDRFENDSLNSHIYISAMDKETAFREVSQIIQQHLQDDNLD